MDRNLIYEAIYKPELRAHLPLNELEQIRDAYPYFTTAHVLLAKIYKERNDHRFADQLQKAAVYVGDRKVLYDFITAQQEVVHASEPLEEKSESAAPTVDVLNDQPTSVIAEFEPPVVNISVESIIDETPVERERTIGSEEDNEVTEALRLSETHTSLAPTVDPVVETFETKSEENITAAEAEAPSEEKSIKPSASLRAADIDPLNKEILIEAVHSSIELEVEESEDEESQIDEEEALDVRFTSSEQSPIQEPKTYAEWIMWKANKMNGLTGTGETTAPVRQEPLEQADRSTVEPSSFQRIDKPEPKKAQQSLIDRFIQAQPKITPGKAAEYAPNLNLGKDSLEEDMTFVTETMAKLFAQQGKMDKARKVYKQLMVLHPEKSVYFAAQLKNLNQQKK